MDDTEKIYKLLNWGRLLWLVSALVIGGLVGVGGYLYGAGAERATMGHQLEDHHVRISRLEASSAEFARNANAINAKLSRIEGQLDLLLRRQ